MERLSLSKQLLLLSAIPLLAMLIFGCNEAQGYLFSKPVEPAVLGRMLKRGLSLVPA